MASTVQTESKDAVRPGDSPSSRREQTARRIVHVDMDAFYAQIEQRDFPEKYAGEPIAVGGRPPRGVVQTASYEARPHGVHSAQPAAEAARKCSDLTFVSPRMEVYKDEGYTIRDILRQYTDLVEPLSLDEAYLDVTEPKKGPPSGTIIAQRIRRQIYEETGLTASAGVGPSKFVAKVASDQDKPDGLTVIRPDEQLDFIAGLPIHAFHGIGPVTAERMREHGIETGADLQGVSVRRLSHHFGKRGRFFKKMAMGEDTRRVQPHRERKSVGAERTFREDLTAVDAMMERLDGIAERVARRLDRAGREGRTVTLKLKSDRHEVSTRQTTLDRSVHVKDELLVLAERLLHRPRPPKRPVRLLGLSVSSLVAADSGREGEQLELNFSDVD